MKIGDLIRDKEYPEDIGMIIEISEGEQEHVSGYRILDLYGRIAWFSKYYVERGCVPVKETK
tara:strand:- start:310 stop:495 length:186 start_codon:yes stop_codon:yes gene_type:complete